MAENLPSRFERHTQQCQACRGAYQRLAQIQQGGRIGAIAALVLALVKDGWLRGLLALALVLAVATIAIADHLQARF